MAAGKQIGLESIFDTSQFMQGLNQYMSGLRDATSQTQSAATQQSGVFGSLGEMISGFGSTAASAFGNVAQIITGFLFSHVILGIVGELQQLTGQALEAAANFQVLGIQVQGLIALQISDLYNANHKVAESTQQLVNLTGEESAKLQDLTLHSSDLHSQMELLERKIPELSAKFGENSAEVNLAQNKLARYGIDLSETDAKIAALNEKNGVYVTVTKLVQGATLDMAEALKQASGPAQALLGWIQDFAIKTPFTVQNLSQLVRGFLALGDGVPETERMVTALANLGAGLGLTDENISQVARELQVMSRNSKVTERELRSLGTQGIPLNRIFEQMAEKMGITREAAVEFAKSGKEGLDAFMEAFQATAEKDFPKALDNLSATWAVAASNIKDVIESLFGKEVLGPVLADFAKLISGGIDQVLAMRSSFAAVGQTIAAAFQNIEMEIGPLSAALGSAAGALLNLLGIDLSKFSLTEAISAAGDAVVTMMVGLEDVSKWFTTTIIPAATSARDWLVQNWPAVNEKIQAGLDILGKIYDWFNRDALPPIQKFVGDAQVQLGNLITWINGTGIPAVQGFIAAFDFSGAFNQAEGNPFETLALAMQNFASVAGPAITAFIDDLAVKFPIIGTIIGAVGTAFVVLQADVMAAWPLISSAIGDLGTTLQGFGITWDDVGKTIGFVIGLIAVTIEAAVIIIVSAIYGIIEGLNAMLQVWQYAQTFIQAIIVGLQTVIAGFRDFLTGVFTLDLPLIFTGLLEIAYGWATTLIGIFGLILTNVGALLALIGYTIAGFVSGIIQMFTNLYDQLVGHSIVPDMLEAMYKIIVDGMVKVTQAFQKPILDLIGWLNGQIQTFVDFGKNFAEGIARGILLMANQIADAAVKVVTDAIKAAKDALDSHSPSKVASDELGSPIGEGVAQGILEAAAQVRSAMESITLGNIYSVSPNGGSQGATTVQNVINNTYEVNANYANTQSPANIRYDLEALLVSST